MKTFRNGWVIKIGNKYVVQNEKDNPCLLRNAKFFSSQKLALRWLKNHNIKKFTVLAAKISSLDSMTLGHHTHAKQDVQIPKII